MTLAVTMGDPAGIGGELTLRAWLERADPRTPAYFAVDDPARLGNLAKSLGWNVPVREIAAPDEAAAVFPNALPVLPQPLCNQPSYGRADAENAGPVIASIDRAVALAMSGSVNGIVTQPIHKASLYGAGFGFPGHTEYLAHLCGIEEAPIMMLAGGGLRVVPLTIHQSLISAIAAIDGPLIEHFARRIVKALKDDFGIAQPRLALAGLNPHAGEGGSMGDEEIHIVSPAADNLRKEGLNIVGPLAPDSMFHAAARAQYDAALCLYHDQALIPLKTIAFDEGVNVTLGLPIVRTSPDHGTAFDIAGKGIANPSSFAAALRLAAEMAARRER